MEAARLVRTMVVVPCFVALWAGWAWGSQPRIERGPAEGEAASDPETPQRPALARRLVAWFGFDEPAADLVGLPRHWVRAQDDPVAGRVRPGFPIWNGGRLDRTVSHGGAGSVVLPAEGGSASLRLRAGVVPVFPGGDYAVRAFVRTANVSTSRARLTARLLTAEGEAIEGSESHSRLVDSGGVWTAVQAVVKGKWEEAAFLQVDLELLQAREFSRPRLGAHQTWVDDFGARAWFDEVAIAQVPSTSIRTSSAMGVSRAPDRPAIHVEARDFTGEPIDAVIRVFDDRGEVVARHDAGRAHGRFRHAWEPALDRYGWFRVVLEFRAAGALLSTSEVDTIRLPPRETAGEADRRSLDRFGLVVPEGGVGDPEEVVGLNRLARPRRVVLPVGVSGAGVRPEALDDWLGPLQREGTEVVLRVGPEEALEGGVGGEPAGWFEGVLRRFAPSVSGWLLDSAGWGAAQAADLGEVIESLAGRGRVYQSWSTTRRWPERPGEGVLLRVPRETPAGAIELIAEDLAEWVAGGGSEGVQIDLVVEPIGAERFGERQAVIDLVQRTTRLLWALDKRELTDSARVLLPDGWGIDAERGRAQPRASLAAWINLADRFRDRSVVGKVELGGGVEGYVLGPRSRDSDRGGALVAWSNRIGGRSELSAPLAEEAVRVYDAYGNATGVERDEEGRHVIPIGEEPVVAEPIDAGVLLFMSGARVEPGLLDSTSPVHEAFLVLENPWGVAVGGEIEFLAPEGVANPDAWEITPRIARVEIPAGGRARVPLTIGFSRYEASGGKRLRARVDLRARREITGMMLSAPFEIGLPGLRLDASYRPAPGADGPDAVIDVRVMNTGETERAFELRAYPRGMARQRGPTTVLRPGRTMTHRFVLRDGVEALRGERVPVTLRDVDSSGTLNAVVEIR